MWRRQKYLGWLVLFFPEVIEDSGRPKDVRALLKLINEEMHSILSFSLSFSLSPMLLKMMNGNGMKPHE